MADCRLRKISNGQVTTVAGQENCATVNHASDPLLAQFKSVCGITKDIFGNFFIADVDGTAGTIRKFVPSSGATSTVMNMLSLGISAASDGSVVFTALFEHVVVRLPPGGGFIIVAGFQGSGGFADGTGNAARFTMPICVAVDPVSGNYMVGDSGNNRLRMVTPSGVVTTYAGNGMNDFMDGPALSARFTRIFGVFVDSVGKVFVTDTDNHRIRRIAGNPLMVTTVAGDGFAGFLNGPPMSARFNYLFGLTSDAQGYLIVADAANNRYRRVPADATVTAPVTPAAVNEVSFWTEEGEFLFGNLMIPPNLRTDYHDHLYPNLPIAQPPAASRQIGGKFFLGHFAP
jgi:hypothetical protein